MVRKQVSQQFDDIVFGGTLKYYRVGKMGFHEEVTKYKEDVLKVFYHTETTFFVQ
jgi:hypothetical protein